jgi:hypothetical protein
MIFLRPFTSLVRDAPNLVGDYREEDLFEYVDVGRPAAATYAILAPWYSITYT